MEEKEGREAQDQGEFVISNEGPQQAQLLRIANQQKHVTKNEKAEELLDSHTIPYERDPSGWGGRGCF